MIGAKRRWADGQSSSLASFRREGPETVVVEQVHPTHRVLSSEGGPPYRVGQRYVLFLRPGEAPRHVALPQGRYFVNRGAVHSVGPGAVADRARGLDEAVFIREIAAITGPRG